MRLQESSMKPEIELILDSTHDAMIAIDSSQNITLFNKAAELLTEIRAEDALGYDVEMVIDNTRLPAVMKSGVSELNRRQMLGSIEIITNRMPVINEKGVIVGAIAVFRDISELSRLSEEVIGLSQSIDRLRSLFDTLQDAISVVDLQGEIILINDSYKRMAKVEEYKTTRGAFEEDPLHKRVLASAQRIRGVNKFITHLNKHVIIDCSPFYIAGEMKGSIAVIRDFSEIERLNADLSQAKSIIRNLEAKYTFDDIIGSHPKMVDATEKAKLAAATNATLLLRGESGTGKELLAHAIHNASSRRFNQFIRVNCAAISSNLLESEFFGYVEGSFTGAKKEGHKGYFERAHGGTIFLDEIAEIDLNTQAKLLRVLQEKEIIPVGSTEARPVDVRVISATNANLEKLVEEKRFREDLYYRLNVFPITLPALRERKEDIPDLALSLMEKLNREFGRVTESIDGDAMLELMSYSWPGNVRELENIIARAMINIKLSDTHITKEHLPALVDHVPTHHSAPKGSLESGMKLKEYLAMMEKHFLEEALKLHGGNKTETARSLGISLRSLYNKIERK